MMLDDIGMLGEGAKRPSGAFQSIRKREKKRENLCVRASLDIFSRIYTF